MDIMLTYAAGRADRTLAAQTDRLAPTRRLARQPAFRTESIEQRPLGTSPAKSSPVIEAGSRPDRVPAQERFLFGLTQVRGIARAAQSHAGGTRGSSRNDNSGLDACRTIGTHKNLGRCPEPTLAAASRNCRAWCRAGAAWHPHGQAARTNSIWPYEGHGESPRAPR
jgi:hypothetical protein